MEVLKKILKTVGIILVVLVLCVAALFGYLTATEFKPGPEEAEEVSKGAGRTVTAGDTISIMTWNIGYGALGDNADFFMDGGKGVRTADKERVQSNLDGILSGIEEADPDILLLQEVDRDSARSYHRDEADLIRSGLSTSGGALAACDSTFSTNYKVAFVPYPVPPIGKVDSGILTLSSVGIESAERIQLPCPFSWPVRLGNLKRCLNISYIPLEGSSKMLVLVNLHLEAYDSGEGKAAQTEMLSGILQKEADAGNYVIAGGDFNQVFSSVDTSMYPTFEGNWQCGLIDEEAFDPSLQFEMDNTHPTCRSLDRPLDTAEETDPEHFQYYMIDGFIVSGNLKVVSLETLDKGFSCTDHNPVLMQGVLE